MANTVGNVKAANAEMKARCRETIETDIALVYERYFILFCQLCYARQEVKGDVFFSERSVHTQ